MRTALSVSILPAPAPCRVAIIADAAALAAIVGGAMMPAKDPRHVRFEGDSAYAVRQDSCRKSTLSGRLGAAGTRSSSAKIAGSRNCIRPRSRRWATTSSAVRDCAGRWLLICRASASRPPDHGRLSMPARCARGGCARPLLFEEAGASHRLQSPNVSDDCCRTRMHAQTASVRASVSDAEFDHVTSSLPRRLQRQAHRVQICRRPSDRDRPVGRRAMNLTLEVRAW